MPFFILPFYCIVRKAAIDKKIPYDHEENLSNNFDGGKQKFKQQDLHRVHLTRIAKVSTTSVLIFTLFYFIGHKLIA